MSDSETRRRWITVGEIIALLALIVSAVGVWIAWKSSNEDRTTRVVEQRSVVPLALRGSVDGGGDTLTIMPADPAHALEGLTVAIKGGSTIEVGSDGKLSASDVQSALKGREKEAKDVTHSVPVRIDARYVEMGKDRRSSGTYTLRYMWKGGGLFGGRTLHLVGISR